jgi:hypothetical protein
MTPQMDAQKRPLMLADKRPMGECCCDEIECKDVYIERTYRVDCPPSGSGGGPVLTYTDVVKAGEMAASSCETTHVYSDAEQWAEAVCKGKSYCLDDGPSGENVPPVSPSLLVQCPGYGCNNCTDFVNTWPELHIGVSGVPEQPNWETDGLGYSGPPTDREDWVLNLAERVNKMFTVKSQPALAAMGAPLASLLSTCSYASSQNICGDSLMEPGYVDGYNIVTRLQYGAQGWVVDVFGYGNQASSQCGGPTNPERISVNMTIACGNAGNTVGDIRNLDSCNPQGIYECGAPTGGGASCDQTIAGNPAIGG